MRNFNLLAVFAAALLSVSVAHAQPSATSVQNLRAEYNQAVNDPARRAAIRAVVFERYSNSDFNSLPQDTKDFLNTLMAGN